MGQTVRRVIQAIAMEIKELGGSAYFVGGAVRDELLKKAIKDFDIEVFGIEPDILRSVCRRYGKVITVGNSFAVMKVNLDGETAIDVSIPRRERSTGLGHRAFDVEADPWMHPEEAAQRRDLTVNAISKNILTGEYIDPFHGIDDLKNGVLKHVGPCFVEDPLRVLRVIRFAAQLGFIVHDETILLCRQMCRDGMLQSLPRERIEEEIFNLFAKGTPGHIFTALSMGIEMEIYQSLFPELHRLKGIVQDPRHHGEGDALTHTFLTVDRAAGIAERDGLDEESRKILCLSALVHDLGKADTTEVADDGSITSYGHDKAGIPLAESLVSRITVNNSYRQRVMALMTAHMRPLHLAVAEKVTDSAIRRLAKFVQPSSLLELSRLVEADTLASLPGEGHDKINAHLFLLERAKLLGVTEQPPDPFIQGRDLIRLARADVIPERYSKGGTHFGTILKKVYEAQLDGQIHSLAEAELYLQSLVSDPNDQ